MWPYKRAEDFGEAIEGQKPSAGPFVQSTKVFLEIGLIGSILDDFPDFYVIRKHGTITVQPICPIIDEQEEEGRSEHRALWDSTLYEYDPEGNRPERRMALVARELTSYKVHIAAVGEILFFKEDQMEVGAGYAFF
ncbi:hypothetical protein SprV_0401599800 [Sparganum proliferum]